jgi:hypothetical protein
VVGGILFIGFIVVCAVIGIGCFGFWLWSLIHALTNNGLSGSEKVAWVLVILFVQLIGSIIYFFVARPKAKSGPPVASLPS